MSNVQAQIERLEGLLARVQVRAGEPRTAVARAASDWHPADDEVAPDSEDPSSDPMRSPMATLVGVAPAPLSMSDALPPEPRHAHPAEPPAPAESAPRIVAAPIVESGPTVEFGEAEDDYGVEVSSEIVEVEVEVDGELGEDDLIEDESQPAVAAAAAPAPVQIEDAPASSKRAITLPPERDPFADEPRLRTPPPPPPASGRQIASSAPGPTEPQTGWREPGLVDDPSAQATVVRRSHRPSSPPPATASAPTSMTHPDLPSDAAVAHVTGDLPSEGESSFGDLLDRSLSL